jgi:hypothetical protein
VTSSGDNGGGSRGQEDGDNAKLAAALRRFGRALVPMSVTADPLSAEEAAARGRPEFAIALDLLTADPELSRADVAAGCRPDRS